MNYPHPHPCQSPCPLSEIIHVRSVLSRRKLKIDIDTEKKIEFLNQNEISHACRTNSLSIMPRRSCIEFITHAIWVRAFLNLKIVAFTKQTHDSFINSSHKLAINFSILVHSLSPAFGMFFWANTLCKLTYDVMTYSRRDHNI